MAYLLAFDVGTTQTKAVMTTSEGRVIATASESYPVYYPRPHWAEQDPEDWWRAIGTTCRAVLEKSGVAADSVLGLAFSNQMLNVICLDSNFVALGQMSGCRGLLATLSA